MSKSEDWVKSHTRDLTDPRFIRLSWAERGVYDATARYSKSNSDVPGLFVRDDHPLSADDIALGIGARNANDQRLIGTALDAFVRVELMTFNPRTGYELAEWDTRQSGTAKEGRDAWRRRQRNKRDRDAAKARQQRAAAAGGNVTPLRPALAPRVTAPDEEAPQ